MASVYRAKDLTTSRIVAVKVLTMERPFDLARFVREAAVLQTVHHENVVDYVAHGQASGVHYLVQEWVDGDTLGAHQRMHGITARDAIVVGIGVASALGAIHALGVIHRDVKPSNIILAGGAPSSIKLVDFGIARAESQAGVLTRGGVMLGTPSYMAPEQAQGRLDIDARADVWALGCVLYEALTGRIGFAGKSPSAIRAKVLLGEPPPVARMCPEAPPELCELVGDMLAKEPDVRPRDGAEVSARLRALPEIPGGPARQSGRSEPTTVAMPVRPARHEASSFVYLAPAEDEVDAAHQAADVAGAHALEVHGFEDGSALLVSRMRGKDGAVEAARAALELRRDAFDGAVSVFAQSASDSFEDAVDRGVDMLDRSMVGNLFAGESAVPIDPVVAELIQDEIPIDRTDAGIVLRERTYRG